MDQWVRVFSVLLVCGTTATSAIPMRDTHIQRAAEREHNQNTLAGTGQERPTAAHRLPTIATTHTSGDTNYLARRRTHRHRTTVYKQQGIHCWRQLLRPMYVCSRSVCFCRSVLSSDGILRWVTG